MTEKTEIDFVREYDRGMFRSELVSLFWSVIAERKKSADGFTLQRLADKLGVNKSQVSRWFNGLPNWEADTVADISGALEVDLQLIARDRHNGKVYTATGPVPPVVTVSSLLTTGPATKRPFETEATGRERVNGYTYTQAAA